jgi:hypothetical protein
MEDRSFFSKLFDFSFSSFVTTDIIKIIYGLAIFFSVIMALGFIISGFNAGAAWGILALLVSPLVFLLYVMACRVWLEIVIVIFRIAENTQAMAGIPPASGDSEEPSP